MSKSNTQLQEDVLAELKFEPSIDAAEIGVTANDGIVGLRGKVKSFAEKYGAVRAAERVKDVKAVTDELEVDLPAYHIRDDEDIARAAIRALEWDVWVPSKKIKVKVSDGWVTLEGSVDYWYEQNAAVEAVRNLTGVKGVTNMISIKKPAVIPSEVKANIDSALRRAAEIDADRVTVKVVNDKVILNGKVSSWAERQEAERAAWSAAGVNEVEDDLVVAT
jgi:osmotically-inducible protein OsmY